MPNPWMIVGSIFVLLGVYGYAHHAGFVQRDQEMQLEIAKKNEESRAAEQKLNTQLNVASAQLSEANNAITEKQSSLDRAIRAGKLRVSTPGCVQASPSTAVASGSGDTSPSESERQTDGPSNAERETLAAIAEIVAQGDRNTVQLNACIDAYNTVREQLNAQGR